jgi:putative component of toxin-antitoxin plasmid stabilization module
VAGQFLRDTFVYENYFWDFYNSQKVSVQGIVDFVIGLVRTLRIVPEKFLKHLEGTDGLYEMRIKVGSNIYRVFCFFDEGNLVILLGGFQKKSAKTPPREITNAEKLKKEYYYERSKK